MQHIGYPCLRIAAIPPPRCRPPEVLLLLWEAALLRLRPPLLHMHRSLLLELLLRRLALRLWFRSFLLLQLDQVIKAHIQRHSGCSCRCCCVGCHWAERLSPAGTRVTPRRASARRRVTTSAPSACESLGTKICRALGHQQQAKRRYPAAAFSEGSKTGLQWQTYKNGKRNL